jgi:hypothetical protein
MMREFQAENDRHQTTIENNLTTLINATTDQGNLTKISNDQSPIQSISMINKQTVISNDNSNQSRISGNISELRTGVDKNKLNIKTPSRLTCDTPAVRFCFIYQFFNLLYSRHPDVQHMICMEVYPIFMYESSKVTE